MSTEPKASILAFEKRYSDNTGIEFAVRLKNGNVQFESVCELVDFPVGELDWLIASLNRIRCEVKE